MVFLVGEEAFEHHAGDVVTTKPGMPIQVGGVLVDFLSVGPNEKHLDAALNDTTSPVVPAGVLAT